MASIDTHPVMYATFSVFNTGVDSNGDVTVTIPAELEQTYDSPMIYKANDYVMAVERLEVNTNGVPFYNGSALLETIKVNTVAGVFDSEAVMAFDGYSLADTIQLINIAFLAATSTNISEHVTVSVNTEGFVIMKCSDFITNTWAAFLNFDMTNAPILNRILGLNPTDIVNASPSLLVSLFPRWDCGDNLSFLRITSNLPTVSDVVGQSSTNVLTDLYFAKNLSASYNYAAGDATFGTSAISYSQRQKIVYNPTVRRFINLRSSGPIDNIVIRIQAVSSDGVSTVIPLPIGCEFTIKLGFWNLLNTPTPRDTNFNSKVIGGKRMIVF